jgi:two-component system cell cycle response regulator
LREYQAVGQDITESKNLEDALQAAEANLRQLIVSNADGMVVTSEDGIVLFVNPAAERLLGNSSYGLLGRAFEYPLTPGQRQELELNSGEPGRAVAEMRVVETKWRGAKAFLATLRDISELKLLQEELRDMSLVDELTGIYNRRGFSTLARQQLKTAQRMGRRVHLFFVDLDQLKKINDTMGHSQGDRAIRETALVLRATFRESDILGRWGGDEFSVLAMDTDEEGTQAVMKRLKQNLDDWNTDTARPYKISFSTGAATYNPERPETLENLIAQADRDMYESKRGRQSVKQPSRLARIGVRD